MGTRTEAPIIGILSQETYMVDQYFPGEVHDSYIAASYVKYLESAGSRVVPVWIGQKEDYYRRVVNYTNGILFPGGATYFDIDFGYGEAATLIYKLAVESNNQGHYYPVWGICLGLQVLPFAAVGEDLRIDCSLVNRAVPLDFTQDFHRSRLFLNASKDIISILRSHDATYNYHKFCLTEEILEKNGILSDWKILSTNQDDTGINFISIMESVKYPIYGIQFHPEKVQFEFKSKAVPHDVEAVKISQYFANFFVGECRRNTNSFPDKDIETKSLIYNYSARYTGKLNASFEQVYVFDKEDFLNAQLD